MLLGYTSSCFNVNFEMLCEGQWGQEEDGGNQAVSTSGEAKTETEKCLGKSQNKEQ